MASNTVRYVNVIPTVKLQKKKPIENIAEDTVSCRVCNKGFASEMALTNHVRMEHIEVFALGDPENWMQEPIERKPVIKNEELVKIKTEELISSMEPTSLMSLASSDVSYIIFKNEDAPITPTRKRKEKEKDKEKPAEKRTKEPMPITGPFECTEATGSGGVCHQMFLSCCEYSMHARDEHSRRRRASACQVCEKPLHPGPPHTCRVCAQPFESREALSAHCAAAHSALKPFECGVCHKRFTQQGGVQQHMRMHTGDRPYACTFCAKAFTQKSGLDQHLRIHTKVKPYRCVLCSKTFCQSVHLKQHMRTHTNVSPFQCVLCEKRFKQSSHLNYHLKYHNPTTMTEQQRAKYARLLGLVDEATHPIATQEEAVLEEDAYVLGEDGEEWSVQLVEQQPEEEEEAVKTERIA